MSAIHTTFYRSEIGFLKITGFEHGIHSIEFTEETAVPETELPVCLRDCVRQLDEYFEGRRKIFDLKLKPEGTDFQKRVWQELLNIPYGKTATYLDIAKAIDNVKAIRAVGAANGQNHIPIIIPCHRVIGRDGSLIGFGGGIWRKEFLLRHEGALMV